VQASPVLAVRFKGLGIAVFLLDPPCWICPYIFFQLDVTLVNFAFNGHSPRRGGRNPLSALVRGPCPSRFWLAFSDGGPSTSMEFCLQGWIFSLGRGIDGDLLVKLLQSRFKCFGTLDLLFFRRSQPSLLRTTYSSSIPKYRVPLLSHWRRQALLVRGL